MKKWLVLLFVLSFQVTQAVATDGKAVVSLVSGNVEVVLLGDKEMIPFDDLKAAFIVSSIYSLLRSCTATTKIESIPKIKYKGVRITQSDGKVIEAHITPNSLNSYMIEFYTKEKNVTELHGKYDGREAYSLITMLEVKKH